MQKNQLIFISQKLLNCFLGQQTFVTSLKCLRPAILFHIIYISTIILDVLMLQCPGDIKGKQKRKKVQTILCSTESQQSQAFVKRKKLSWKRDIDALLCGNNKRCFVAEVQVLTLGMTWKWFHSPRFNSSYFVT